IGEPLAEMGMTDAFAPDRADFTGMRGERDLHLSLALQQTLLAVDETGVDVAPPSTEAPPRTVAESASRRLAPMFRADHPFLFLLWDRISGRPVLIGRLMQPSASPKVVIA